MASPSSEVIDTTKPIFDLSLRKSTANRLDYLYEISHVPENSKIIPYRLKRPPRDYGKQDSLKTLRTNSSVFYFDYQVQCSDVINTEDPLSVATVNHRAY